MHSELPRSAPNATSASLRTRLRAVLMVVLLLTAGATAVAQDGLYGPDAPRDVAFLRVLNATEDAVEPRLDGAALEPVAPGTVTAYRTLEPGLHTVAAAPEDAQGERAPTEFEAFPEGFVTVALLPGEVRVIEDAALRDISRGLLSLVNLTADGALRLETLGGDEVFASVAPGASGSRAINQAEVGFALIGEGGATLAELEARTLERGVAHTLFALPPLGNAGSDTGDDTGAGATGVRLIYVAASAQP